MVVSTLLDSTVGNAQSAGNIQKYVFLHQLEAYPFFEHGQEHVQPALVKASGRPLGGSVSCRRNQGLGLDKEGAYALYGRGDGNAAEPLVVLR